MLEAASKPWKNYEAYFVIIDVSAWRGDRNCLLQGSAAQILIRAPVRMCSEEPLSLLSFERVGCDNLLRGGTPQRDLDAHLSYQQTQICLNLWSPSPSP